MSTAEIDLAYSGTRRTVSLHTPPGSVLTQLPTPSGVYEPQRWRPDTVPLLENSRYTWPYIKPVHRCPAGYSESYQPKKMPRLWPDRTHVTGISRRLPGPKSASKLLSRQAPDFFTTFSRLYSSSLQMDECASVERPVLP